MKCYTEYFPSKAKQNQQHLLNIQKSCLCVVMRLLYWQPELANMSGHVCMCALLMMHIKNAALSRF